MLGKLNERASQVQLEIDKLTEKQIIENQNQLLNDDYVFSFWRSPSNKGFKGLVFIDFKNINIEIDLDKQHKSAFKKLSDYFLSNYNIKKHCGCYARHFVHNLVNADIVALLEYINMNKTNFSPIIIGEIRKSINTISFVIGHMYEELKNAQTFNFFNSKNNHIERNPKKKNKKIIIQN